MAPMSAIRSVKLPREFSFSHEPLPQNDEAVRKRIIWALGRSHGMAAADPGPVSTVVLGPLKNGERAWSVEFGSRFASGTYAPATGTVKELKYGFIDRSPHGE